MSHNSFFLETFFFTACFSIFALGFSGRFIGRVGGIYLLIFCQYIIFIISSFLFVDIIKGDSIYFIFSYWCFPSHTFSWTFLFDYLSLNMCCLVCIITTCVILFTYEYMANDPHFIRFVSYLTMFSFFMIFFVFSGNLIQLFFGWEGVGLVSFLLVNFWFSRVEANRSAIKAILFNRVSDLCFLLFLILYIYIYKSVELPILFQCDIFYINSVLCLNIFGFSVTLNLLKVISLVVFLTASGKSAQLGFHSWLPDAMEGPTPVSALLHSATMVTAGVFLLLRFYCILEKSHLLSFISVVGVLTAFISANFAIFQVDLKKLIAYSTCSQLGFMITSLGLSNPIGSFYHLYTHACFKALLFITAGSIIHSLSGEQDTRKMGGILKYIPFTFISILIGIFGLIGFPFLSGFFSKELIIFTLFFNCMDLFEATIYLVLLTSSLFTIIYSCLLLNQVFIQSYCNTFRSNTLNLKDSSNLTSLSMLILCLLTIFVGFFLEDSFTVSGLQFVNYLYHFSNLSFFFTNLEKDLISCFTKFFFIGVFFIFFNFILLNKITHKNFFKFSLNHSDFMSYLLVGLSVGFIGFNSIFFKISNFFIIRIYSWFFILLDRGFLEYIGPLFFGNIFWHVSKSLTQLESIKLSNFNFIILLNYVLICSHFFGLIFFLTSHFYMLLFSYYFVILDFFLND